MKSAFAGAVAFFLPATTIGLLFCAASLFNRTSPGKDGSSALDDFVLPAYLIVFAMTFAAIGFLVTTMASPAWRGLVTRKAMLVAAGLGMTYPVFYILGLAGSAWLILPLIRSTPRLGTTLTLVIPGVLLGITAILLAKHLRRQKETAT